MPFASRAQQKWANSPTGVRALGGKSKVQEWNNSTDFSSLPEKVGDTPDPVKTQQGALLKARKKNMPRMGGSNG